MPFAATWMELGIMILSEVSQGKTNTCLISYMWNLKRNTNELTQETDSLEKRLIVT